MGTFSVEDCRKSLFSHLDAVLSLSREKMDHKTTLEENRQRWCRILVSAVDCYGNLLKQHEIEELEERVKTLEGERIEQT